VRLQQHTVTTQRNGCYSVRRGMKGFHKDFAVYSMPASVIILCCWI
jgi:hypothetical protein